MHPLELGRDWVRIDDAITLVHKSRRTIYRWAAAGLVRTVKPRGKKAGRGQFVYFNVPDLLAAEATTLPADTPEVQETQL